MERSWARGFTAVVVLAASTWGWAAWAQGNELTATPEKLTASAEKLLEHGDYTNAVPMLLQAANHGDVRAKFVLGEVYEQRLHILLQADKDPALGWFQEAALAGNVDAMVRLGAMYRFDDVDGATDLATAEAWYKRAAEKGSLLGMLGEVEMVKARGGSDEQVVAVLEAWEQKYPVSGPLEKPLPQMDSVEGQVLLRGIASKYEEEGGEAAGHAVAAVILLVALGQPDDAVELADKYAEGDGVPRSPAVAERLLKAAGSAESVTRQYFYHKALRGIADDYWDGKGTAKDATKAVKLYDALAALGEPAVAAMVAGFYACGEGVALNVHEAERRLAAIGDPNNSTYLYSDEYYATEKSLGDDYLNGRGTARDEKKALELYESAAEGGDNDAAVEAGLMYVSGAVAFNESKAEEYLTLEPSSKVPMPRQLPGSQIAAAVKELSPAEKEKYALATRLLAERYERGDGVNKSEWMVRQWYRAAASAGDEIAKEKVSKMSIEPPKLVVPKPAPGSARLPMIVGTAKNSGSDASGGSTPGSSIPSMPPPPPPPPDSAQQQAAHKENGSASAIDALIRGNGPGKQANVLDFPEETVKGDLAKPTPQPMNTRTHLEGEGASVEERYPNIEAPEVVHPAEEFAVTVSLTGEQISPETTIVSGKQNEGRLQIPIPAGMTSIELEVNLTAPGMEFVDGSNIATIELDKGQDSTVAQFHLRVRAGTPAGQPKLMATFWYNHGFLARVERSVEIAAANSAAAPLGAARPMVARTAAVTAAAKPSEREAPAQGFQLDPAMGVPDLTIMERRSGDELLLTFESRYESPVEDTLPKEAEMRTYLRAKFAEMAQHGRGNTVVSTGGAPSGQASEDFARGFGNELWDRFAPPGLKKLYWQLRDAGVRIRTIQVMSDDPIVPWELMRPARDGGKERQDFLGLTTRVARWQMGTSPMSRPPQKLEVERMVVVAPRYAGAMALSGAQAEAASLHTAEGFEEVKGDYSDFRALAANLPAGIVHFAGHGQVKDEVGGAQFAILLEDGEVVPSTWKELASGSTTHPFYFFNACEVGQAQQAVSALDGWGPALLESGASGYMGALWPVNDKAAGAFAGNFYKWMGANPGMPVAEVVRATRQQTYEQTHDLSALAYVLYADPYLEVRR